MGSGVTVLLPFFGSVSGFGSENATWRLVHPVGFSHIR